MATSIHQITGSIGGHTRASRVSEWAPVMAPAWRGQTARFERQVDPDGVLPPDERARRADSARRAEMRRVALVGWQRRRAAERAAGTRP